MAADLSYTLGLDGSSFTGAAQRALSIMGSMELAMQLLGRAGNALGSSFEKAGAMEKNSTAIQTITKSAAKTVAVMRELKQLASATPFEMSDLAPAARMLIGAGTATKDVAKQLRILGDVASGANTDLGGLVSVFNQVRGKGKLSAEEFQQFAERGVAGLREEIAKFKGISLEGVSESLSRGAVSAADLERIFQSMTAKGGVFFKAMEAQSQTFEGKLSTLSDAWSNLQVAFAAPINDALKPVIDDIAGLTDMLAPAFGIVGTQIGLVVTAAREFLLQINEGHTGIQSLGSAFGGLFDQITSFAAVPFAAMANSLPAVGSAFQAVMGPAVDFMLLKMETGAHKFLAMLLSGMSSVAAELPFGLGGGVAGALANQSTAQTQAAGLSATGAVQAGAALEGGTIAAGDAVGDALKSLKEGFSEMFNSVVSEFKTDAAAPAPTYDRRYAGEETAATTMAGVTAAAPAALDLSGQAEVAGSAIAQSFIDRLSSAAVTLPIAAAPPATPSGPGGDAAVANLLGQLLSEMQRINSY